MDRNPSSILVGLVGLLLISGSFRQAAADSKGPTEAKPESPQELGKHIQDLTDTVLQHHLDPPAHQQMILAGIKSLYQAAGLPVPAGLSRRVSALTTPDQLTACLWSSGLPGQRKPSGRGISGRLL